MVAAPASGFQTSLVLGPAASGAQRELWRGGQDAAASASGAPATIPAPRSDSVIV